MDGWTDGRSIQSARELHDHQKHQKTLKSLLRKIIEEEFGLKYDIQNHVPAVIDHTNMSFESSLEMFIGVDHSRYTILKFSF
jgi:hypothetical protein